MFTSALRSQARLGVRAAARVGAVPTISRSLSALVAVSRRATVPSSPSMLLASRSFSRSAVAFFGGARESNPPSKTLFVGNLPWSATREELVELFGEFGDVTNVRIQTHADGRPRGFGHIEFATKEQGIAAVTSGQEEPLHFAGRDLILDYAKDKPMTSVEVRPSNRLYFSKFSDGESALRELMNNHLDEIVSIYFLKDGNTGEELPSGFLEFTNTGTATEALNTLNGSPTPSGESLFLSYARPKRERPDRNAERGGGGGGNRFRNDRGGGGRREQYTSRSWGGRDRQNDRD